jgi:hypothetical protein
MNEQEKQMLKEVAEKMLLDLDKEEDLVQRTIEGFPDDADMMKLMRDIKHGIEERRQIAKDMLGE